MEGKCKCIDFGEGTDYRGELHLSWNGKKFEAYLVVFSDPCNSYGGYFDPPETTWREEEDTFEAIKISDVANWLKKDWGFELISGKDL